MLYFNQVIKCSTQNIRKYLEKTPACNITCLYTILSCLVATQQNPNQKELHETEVGADVSLLTDGMLSNGVWFGRVGRTDHVLDKSASAAPAPRARDQRTHECMWCQGQVCNLGATWESVLDKLPDEAERQGSGRETFFQKNKNQLKRTKKWIYHAPKASFFSVDKSTSSYIFLILW